MTFVFLLKSKFTFLKSKFNCVTTMKPLPHLIDNQHLTINLKYFSKKVKKFKVKNKDTRLLKCNVVN